MKTPISLKKFLIDYFLFFATQNKKSRIIEYTTGIKFSEADFDIMTDACKNSGCTINHYYRWRLRERLAIDILKQSDSVACINFIKNNTHNIEEIEQAVIKADSGILLTTMHYGSFVPAIFALVSHISKFRKICVIYDQPEVNAKNRDFDLIAKKMATEFGDDFTPVHNNSRGLASVIRTLKTGGVAVIMTDVFHSIKNTYTIDFMGRFYRTLLGAAYIARRSNSAIIPFLSKPIMEDYKFKIIRSNHIKANEIYDQLKPIARRPDFYCDHNTISKIYKCYEEMIGNDLIYWLYIFEHSCHPTTPKYYKEINTTQLDAIISKDPRINAAKIPEISI
ncbi:hypothetical protein XACN24_13535 [Xanthomonas albilineans]|uniref:LpxL/LpxP family acyltransferase n=1 Tax=Xanthomonas albilineans TaxID=29447 RepID=UPI001374F326|nr:hypothetical protein [Xanthomonas albilineans]